MTGIVGPQKDRFKFPGMREWVTDVQEFKEDIVITIIENKIKSLGMSFQTELA